MDTDKADTLYIRLVACVIEEEARDRLIEKHGFTLDNRETEQATPENIYLEKVAFTTYDDAITYSRTLKSIPGILYVQVLIDDGPAEGEPEPAHTGAE